MHEFSTLDGFVDISECTAEMIKYIANEPSVGLFYVQQHTRNAVPNLVRLRNKISDASHETTLHTEDSEDSIDMVRSMRECGSPIVDEMIRDIKKTLVVMSSKQPRRGLIHDSRSGGLLMDRTGSWGPSNWGRTGEKSGYFSTVFKSATKKTSDFKWAPLDSAQLGRTADRSSSFASVVSTSSSLRDLEAEELPLSCQEKPAEEEESSNCEAEDYDEFKAEREAKLEKWLEEHGGLR